MKTVFLSMLWTNAGFPYSYLALKQSKPLPQAEGVGLVGGW